MQNGFRFCGPSSDEGTRGRGYVLYGSMYEYESYVGAKLMPVQRHDRSRGRGGKRAVRRTTEERPRELEDRAVVAL